MSENIIIEVDLSIHPYQGIIGCFQDKWTGWLEPGFIYYLPRDSPITYDIHPGEYILCKKEPIYECSMGHVVIPIKKLTPDEIIDIINKEPKIKIFEWDKLYEKKTVLNLAKKVFQSLNKLKLKNALTKSQVKKLAQDLEDITKITDTSFLYPEMKLRALDLITERLSQDFFERIITQLTKYKYQIFDESQLTNRNNYYAIREARKIGVLTRNEFLALLFPEIRLACKKFIIDYEMIPVFNRIIASENSEKEKYDELKLEIMSTFEQYIVNVGTETINIEWVKSIEFEDLKKRVLDIRVKEVNNALILTKAIQEDEQDRIQYNITNLRKTYMGGRLLESLKISNSVGWIDEPIFNLINAALRKFKVELKIEKQK